MTAKTDDAAPPHRYRIYFDPRTGFINGDAYSNTPMDREGCGHVDLAPELYGTIYDHTHKVDLKKKSIVLLTAAERAEVNAPKPHEVAAAVYQELKATDEMMAPDRFDDAELAKWRAYRQALRDLSKQGLSHHDQLRAWPVRPDGFDPAVHLKSRIRKNG